MCPPTHHGEMENVPRDRRPTGGVDLILLAGVPGAGKSTALRALATCRPDLTRIDSDDPRQRLAALLGPRIGYRWYRPVVHLCHAMRVAASILRGPRQGRRLVVHHPGTARAFRGSVARLGRLRGWSPAVIFVDTGQEDALAGQRERGRMVRDRAFRRHWERWLVVLGGIDVPGSAVSREPWSRIHLGTRDEVVPLVDALTRHDGELGSPVGAGAPRRPALLARHEAATPPNPSRPETIWTRLRSAGSLPEC